MGKLLTVTESGVLLIDINPFGLTHFLRAFTVEWKSETRSVDHNIDEYQLSLPKLSLILPSFYIR